MKAQFLVLVALVAGCLSPAVDLGPTEAGTDAPLVLPPEAFYDIDEYAWPFHSFREILDHLDALARDYPDIVTQTTIGESRNGLPIRMLTVTLPSDSDRPVAFYDGGHHGNELEGIESTLYLADYLVANAEHPEVRALLAAYEVRIVPIVNPDGYVAQSRGNALGVNLNRNYDLDWGNPAGSNNRAMGAASGATGIPVASFGGGFAENPGAAPFSEPETQAIRDALVAVGDRLAFYVSHHTPAHCITAPWTAPNPPFEMPAGERAVFDAVFDWVEANTEFGAGAWRSPDGECMGYSTSGASQDWAYATFRVPTFTMETAGSEDDEGFGGPEWVLAALDGAPPYPGLAHYMRATLPIELFLLTNAAALRAWSPDLADPLLPPGAPPEGTA